MLQFLEIKKNEKTANGLNISILLKLDVASTERGPYVYGIR